jgi:hypothetical protein
VATERSESPHFSVYVSNAVQQSGAKSAGYRENPRFGRPKFCGKQQLRGTAVVVNSAQTSCSSIKPEHKAYFKILHTADVKFQVLKQKKVSFFWFWGFCMVCEVN